MASSCPLHLVSRRDWTLSLFTVVKTTQMCPIMIWFDNRICHHGNHTAQARQSDLNWLKLIMPWFCLLQSLVIRVSHTHTVMQRRVFFSVRQTHIQGCSGVIQWHSVIAGGCLPSQQGKGGGGGGGGGHDHTCMHGIHITSPPGYQKFHYWV